MDASCILNKQQCSAVRTLTVSCSPFWFLLMLSWHSSPWWTFASSKIVHPSSFRSFLAEHFYGVGLSAPHATPQRGGCSRAAWVQVQGLPSLDEKMTDFISFHVMFLFYDRKGPVMGSFFQIYFLWFYAEWLNNAGEIDSDPYMPCRSNSSFHQKVTESLLGCCQ
jgi:hypothetical protein